MRSRTGILSGMGYQILGSSVALAEAVLKDGTTFVPASAVTEALGGTAEWKHDAKSARLEIGGKVAWIQPDNANAVVDGAAVDMQAAPYLDVDLLWVPARLFRDGFGFALEVKGTDVSIG